MSDGYTVKVKPRYETRVHCSNCGCTDIQVPCWCSWNKAKQRWEYVEFYDENDDGCYCPDCEDTGMEWNATTKEVEPCASP